MFSDKVFKQKARQKGERLQSAFWKDSDACQIRFKAKPYRKEGEGCSRQDDVARLRRV